MEHLLRGFPVVIEIPVAWGEMDAFQHVNNVAYFRYFESARIAYFERLDLIEFMNQTGIGPILASAQCRFKIPLTYPDTVSVGTRVSQIESDRFVMEYVVVSHRLQKVAAQGEGLIVSYNYREQRKAPIPPELRRRISDLEGRAEALEPAGRPNAFTLYERNMGMLTPLIADELRQAEENYPAEWIEEAFREAVSSNKRSWKYVRAVLERWRVEGKGSSVLDLPPGKRLSVSSQ
jgi:acyl-CoA thioester hydrolase